MCLCHNWDWWLYNMIPLCPRVIISIIIILYLVSFPHQRELMVFHWPPSNSKSPQVSMTFLRILTDFNKAVLWMVSIRPPIYNLFSPLCKPLGTVPSVPVPVGITVILMFYILFSPLARSKYLSFFFLTLILILWSGAGNPQYGMFLFSFFFLFVNYQSVRSCSRDLVILLVFGVTRS